MSCTLAELVSTEWIKPGVLVFTDMHLHTVGAAPQSGDTTGYLFGLVHLWVPFTCFVFGGAGSGDQGGIDDRALLHGHALLLEVGRDRFEICWPRSCFSTRCWMLRIVVSSGIRSVIRSIPAKRRMVPTSINASSMAGSLRLYHCCIR